jgi:hypothetical protein
MNIEGPENARNTCKYFMIFNIINTTGGNVKSCRGLDV